MNRINTCNYIAISYQVKIQLRKFSIKFHCKNKIHSIKHRRCCCVMQIDVAFIERRLSVLILFFPSKEAWFKLLNIASADVSNFSYLNVAFCLSCAKGVYSSSHLTVSSMNRACNIFNFAVLDFLEGFLFSLFYYICRTMSNRKNYKCYMRICQ
jgi:hypothetical protein